MQIKIIHIKNIHIKIIHNERKKLQIKDYSKIILHINSLAYFYKYACKYLFIYNINRIYM